MLPHCDISQELTKPSILVVSLTLPYMGSLHGKQCHDSCALDPAILCSGTLPRRTKWQEWLLADFTPDSQSGVASTLYLRDLGNPRNLVELINLGYLVSIRELGDPGELGGMEVQLVHEI